MAVCMLFMWAFMILVAFWPVWLIGALVLVILAGLHTLDYALDALSLAFSVVGIAILLAMLSVAAHYILRVFGRRGIFRAYELWNCYVVFKDSLRRDTVR